MSSDSEDIDIPLSKLQAAAHKDDEEFTEQILRRVKRDDHTLNKLEIGSYHEQGIFKYGPPDLSRLGAAITNNTNLFGLEVDLDENVVEVRDENLLNGLKQNKSIQNLFLDCHNRSIAGTIIHVMLRAYHVNNNLTDIHIWHTIQTRDDHHIITNTLIRNTNLRKIYLMDSDITDDRLLQMVEAIRGHRILEHLALYGNRIGNVGCQALATLLEDPNCNIRELDLSDNVIQFEGAVALANSLATNTKLRKLDLSHNDIFVTSADDPYDSDEDYLSDEHYLDSIVQASFSQILCNTTSIGATYSSNHTLEAIECSDARIDDHLSSLLERNQLTNKSHVAIRKILQYHSNIDMQPMFEWDAEGEQTLKALPYVIRWFDRAGVAVADFRGERYNVEERKLAAIFQFALAMPLLFVHFSHTEVDSKKRKRVDK